MGRGVVGGVELSWGDVMRCSKAIEDYHMVRVSIQLMRSVHSLQSLEVLLMAWPAPVEPSADDLADTRSWRITANFGSTDTLHLAPKLYRLLLEMDEQLSRLRWLQKPLPIPA